MRAAGERRSSAIRSARCHTERHGEHGLARGECNVEQIELQWRRDAQRAEATVHERLCGRGATSKPLSDAEGHDLEEDCGEGAGEGGGERGANGRDD